MSLGNAIYHMFERLTSYRNLITMLAEVYETKGSNPKRNVGSVRPKTSNPFSEGLKEVKKWPKNYQKQVGKLFFVRKINLRCNICVPTKIQYDIL